MAITVNGTGHPPPDDPRVSLLDFLRERLALTGTKRGCDQGACGACTVLLDGAPAMSCLLPAGLAAGRSVRTVESLADAAGGTLSPLQAAMEGHDAVQCGMCFPGILMNLTALFEGDPAPDRDAIRAALDGNVCRCTGYERIVEAALSLVADGGPAEAEA